MLNNAEGEATVTETDSFVSAELTPDESVMVTTPMPPFPADVEMANVESLSMTTFSNDGLSTTTVYGAEPPLMVYAMLVMPLAKVSDPGALVVNLLPELRPGEPPPPPPQATSVSMKNNTMTHLIILSRKLISCMNFILYPLKPVLDRFWLTNVKTATLKLLARFEFIAIIGSTHQ